MTGAIPIETTRGIAAAVRGRRLDLGLSQADLAARARVSRQWVSSFEAGKPTAELGLAMRLLAALGLEISLQARDLAELPQAHGPVDLDAHLDEYRRR